MACPKLPAVGIDLGNTYSCVAVYRSGQAEIIPNDQGHRTTPSMVAFTDYERLVGERAKGQAGLNPNNTIYDMKRFIGRRYGDPVLKADKKHWPFRVVDKDGKPMVKVEYKMEDMFVSPEELTSMLLVKMRKIASAFLGGPVKDAVITVPAYFNDSQRQATKDAGVIAGLNVLRILNEPTAAALAYGLDKSSSSEKNVLVFDLGGGTFDVSVLKINKKSCLQVMATAGDTHLGGEDFDTRMLEYFLEEIKQKHGNKDLSHNAKAMRRLRTACERAKQTLSTTTEASVDIDTLFDGVHFHSKITRAKFEELCADLFSSIIKPVESALADAKLDKARIDDVVLVGGSTRIPKIQKILQEFFKKKDVEHSIDPDEAVAYGAALQAAIVSGVTCTNIKDVTVVDVTPLSLGIETAGGFMNCLIKRGTPVPAKASELFSTHTDDQSLVTIQVYEGENEMTKDNNLLGRFELTGIPPAPRGVPKIEVTFEIDCNNILHVSAVDKSTGQSNTIVIKHDKGRLNNKEIDHLVGEVEKFRQEHEEQEERHSLRQRIEAYISSVWEALKNFGHKLSELEKMTIRMALEEAWNWLKKNIQATIEELKMRFIALQAICSAFLASVRGNSTAGTSSSS